MVQTAKAGKVAAKSAAAREDARRKYEEAEGELITHRQLVARLGTAYAKAARAAAFPGEAPGQAPCLSAPSGRRT